MCIEDYRRQIIAELKGAQSFLELEIIISNADATLFKSRIDKITTRKFWNDIYNDLRFQIREQNDNLTHEIALKALEMVSVKKEE